MALFDKKQDDKKTEENSVVIDKTNKKSAGQAYRVLVKPHVTEKATTAGGLNKYIFVVNNEANKITVAKAIFEVYGVKPASVNILNIKGKRVVRGRTSGRRKDWRKAIITLPKGKSIAIYEGV
jgi:large subunit ribosomal protein L23